MLRNVFLHLILPLSRFESSELGLLTCPNVLISVGWRRSLALNVHRDVYYHPAHSASEPNQGTGVTVGLEDI
jgi:hypothetical protein